jgi:hypothetical protein
MIDTIQERVSAGARALDALNPGWEYKINLDRLNVASPENCVLGQLYAHYGDAPDALRDNEVGLGFYAEGVGAVDSMSFEDYWARAHVISDQINNEYRDLTNNWHELITCRREEAAAHEELIEQAPVPKASFNDVIASFQQELDRITRDRVSHILVAV